MIDTIDDIVSSCAGSARVGDRERLADAGSLTELAAKLMARADAAG